MIIIIVIYIYIIIITQGKYYSNGHNNNNNHIITLLRYRVMVFIFIYNNHHHCYHHCSHSVSQPFILFIISTFGYIIHHIIYDFHYVVVGIDRVVPTCWVVCFPQQAAILGRRRKALTGAAVRDVILQQYLQR